MGNPTDYVEVEDIIAAVRDLYYSSTYEYDPGGRDALRAVLIALDIPSTELDDV